MTTNNGNGRRRAIFTDHHGQRIVFRVSRQQARRLDAQSRDGSIARAIVDLQRGAVTGILGGNGISLDQQLARFRLPVDPSPFFPYVSDQWEEWIAQWMDAERMKILLYGPEGTGKDTLLRLFLERLTETPGDTEVLTLPAEEDDRFVGHQETKVRELKAAVARAKKAARRVVLYLPEIERLFATGDITASWQLQWNATVREMLDGTQQLQADYILAATNYLDRLGGPVLSRFQKFSVTMCPEMAEGILEAHWPSEYTNGLTSDYVLQKMFHEKIGEATLASRKKVPLRATDLTGFNGRFLTDFAGDLGRRVRLQRRKSPGFSADECFADEVLSDHLKAIVAPLTEAAGTRAIRQFLVRLPNPVDLPVAVELMLDWREHSRFLA